MSFDDQNEQHDEAVDPEITPVTTDPETVEPNHEQPVISQPDPETQPDVEPLPAPDVAAGQPPLIESAVDGPGLSPLAHNPDLVNITNDAPAESASLAQPSDEVESEIALDAQIADARADLNALLEEKENQPIPPPANVPENPATGKVDNLGNPDVIQCPVCQALFVPPTAKPAAEPIADEAPTS